MKKFGRVIGVYMKENWFEVLKSDLMTPLDKVNTVWLRRGITIILTQFVSLIGAVIFGVGGFFETLKYWVKTNW
jgi:hypothetical protein